MSANASAAPQRGKSNLLIWMMMMLVIALGGLASALPAPDASAPNAPRANSPPVQPLTSEAWGALEAEAIAVYYATDKDMPRQEVDGIGPVIGWKGHVVERHGAETWKALWQALGKGGWNRHECDDGKTYLTKRVPGHEDTWWFAAIGSKVIDSARLVITGFSGDRGAILAPVDRDDCEPELQLGHDFAGG